MMDDVEQQCEDALFELCDARERYPLQCANELQKSIKLKNEINMMVLKNSTITDKPTILKQNEHSNVNVNEDTIRFNHLDLKLQNIINKMDNLKAVMDQIKREKTCSTNKLLEG